MIEVAGNTKIRRTYNRVYLWIYEYGGWHILDSPRCFIFGHRWEKGTLRQQARCTQCGVIRHKWYEEQIRG